MAKSYFKKVIVAVNGHVSSIHAAMYAIMMAKTYNLLLKFVYVVDVDTIKYLTMNHLLVTDEKNEFEERLRSDGEHYLSYVEMLAASKGLKTEKELLSGGVFSELIKASDDYEADLLIIGKTHKDILDHAHCPVLVVNKEKIEAEFKVF